MRAAVLDAAHLAVFAAPHHELVSERRDRTHAAARQIAGFRDDVPATRQARVEQRLGALLEIRLCHRMSPARPVTDAAPLLRRAARKRRQAMR